MPKSHTELLRIIAATLGTDVDTMLDDATFDSVSPGICIECHSVTDSLEPDATTGWCEGCDGNAVQSALVLAGML